MDLRKVKKLIELLQESQLSEIEICEGKDRIRLSRMPVVMPARTVATKSHEAEPMNHIQTTVETDHQATAIDPANPVTSPMVGTFYAATTPDDDPYVSLGSKVKQGDTLCMIEAMKTYNQIEADRSGTIQAIYKENGDPVEYGEPLFLIV